MQKKKVILVWSYNYWFADSQYLQTAGKQDSALGESRRYNTLLPTKIYLGQ